MTAIIWLPVVGYEGIYAVSNSGIVVRVALCKSSNKDGSLKHHISRNGYLRVSLYKDRKMKNCLVHRLVMAAFVGVDSREVNHKNGDKTDNRLENLEYVTRSENELHRSRVLKKNIGENHGNSKLTNTQVTEIRAKATPYKHGIYAQLSREYGVTEVCIRFVVIRQSYPHVA